MIKRLLVMSATLFLFGMGVNWIPNELYGIPAVFIPAAILTVTLSISMPGLMGRCQ